jgi:hypothetical protein
MQIKAHCARISSLTFGKPRQESEGKHHYNKIRNLVENILNELMFTD